MSRVRIAPLEYAEELGELAVFAASLRGAWGRNFNRPRRYLQVVAAVGTKLVGFGDFALALRAGGVQVTFAVGAEVEPRAHCVSALRARIRQRLAHQKIISTSRVHKPDIMPRRFASRFT